MYSFSFCFLLAYPHPLLRLVSSFSFDFILLLDALGGLRTPNRETNFRGVFHGLRLRKNNKMLRFYLDSSGTLQSDHTKAAVSFTETAAHWANQEQLFF